MIHTHIVISWRSLVVLTGAIVMGFISGKYLFHGSMLNIIPWGILALMTAFLAADRRQALILGGLFGFVVSYSFLWFNNTDIHSLEQVFILVVLILLPALFGLVCGLMMAWLGWIIRFKLRGSNA